DQFDRFEITGTGNRKTRLDDIHTQALKGPGNAQLFFLGHRRAGALLAIAQRGVEDDDAIIAAHGKLLTAISTHACRVGPYTSDCRVKYRGREGAAAR